jgi:hypothetical protein
MQAWPGAGSLQIKADTNNGAVRAATYARALRVA